MNNSQDILRPFVDRCLLILATPIRTVICSRLGYEISNEDPRDLLRIMESKWKKDKHILFVSKAKSREMRAFVNELIAKSDNFAHYKKFTEVDAARFIDSAKTLLKEINADATTMAEMESMEKDFINSIKHQQSQSDNILQSSGAPESPRDIIIPEKHHSYANLKGKKVRCPGCHNFVFQTWKSGWDGHAGWKCSALNHFSSPEEKKAEYKRRFYHFLFDKGETT